MQIPAIPDIPEVTIGGGITRPPAPPAIQPPAFLQQKRTPSSAAGAKGKQMGNAAAASGNSGKSDIKKSTALNGLNAKTLAALSQNSGNLTLLNNLLGTDAGLGGNTGLGNVSGLQTDTGGAVLTKILSELEKLQAQTGQAVQKETTSTGNTGTGNAADAHTALAQGAAAELIRLRINGKEIKDDLIYTFCSAPAANGSFLYGADRRFTANGAELNETAYFLCRKTEAQQYEITMDLRQEPLNANSFLYKLYQLSPVSVEQTSDIIFWHYKASDLEVELIFRIVHL